MKCRSVLTRIDALRTGELTPEEQQDVTSHLERCGSCNESTHDLEEFASAVRMLRPEASRSSGGTVLRSLCDSYDSCEIDGRTVWVAFSAKGIRRIDLGGGDAEAFIERHRATGGRELRREPLPAKYRDAIAAALRGESSRLPDVDLSQLSEFEREVLATIRRIPRGEVRTYEWVARAVRRPKAVRAVGNVMASNPVPLIFPCHRVVPAAGGIGNYAFGGSMKRALLEAEGTPVDEIEDLARRGVRFVGSRTTKIFCCPTCRDARRIQEQNRVLFRSAAEAERNGFRACKHCTPVAA